MEDEINLYEPVNCTNFFCFLCYYAHRKTKNIKVANSYIKGIIITRKYLATTIIIAVVTLSFMSIAAGYDVLSNRGLYEVSHERVELRGGFWDRRLKTHREVTIPHVLDCLERNGHVTNFDMADETQQTGNCYSMSPYVSVKSSSCLYSNSR